MKKLNLGCGNDVKEGWVNVDREISPLGVEFYDIDKSNPQIIDNTFDLVFANHILEHAKDLPLTIRELYRISKSNCEWQIIAPYFSNPSYYNDPTHHSRFALDTFHYYEDNSLFNYDCFTLVVLKKKLMFMGNKGFMKSRAWWIDWIFNISPITYQRFFSYWIPCTEIHYKIKVIK